MTRTTPVSPKAASRKPRFAANEQVCQSGTGIVYRVIAVVENGTYEEHGFEGPGFRAMSERLFNEGFPGGMWYPDGSGFEPYGREREIPTPAGWSNDDDWYTGGW